MAEEEKKDSRSKIIIILLIILIVVLIAGIAVGAVLFLNNNGNGTTDTAPAQTEEITEKKNDNPLILDYDSSAVGLDEDSLSKAFDEMREKAKNGYVNLKFKNVATSDDGVHFSCYLGNSEANIYDMFFNIYKDAALSEQVWLSGLVAPGNVIESFESEIKLETGEYEAMILFTSVSDDHSTMVSQVPVSLTLVVN